MSNFTEAEILQILNYLDETVNEYFSHFREKEYRCTIDLIPSKYSRDFSYLENRIKPLFNNKYNVNCGYTGLNCIKDRGTLSIHIDLPRKEYKINLTPCE